MTFDIRASDDCKAENVTFPLNAAKLDDFDSFCDILGAKMKDREWNKLYYLVFDDSRNEKLVIYDCNDWIKLVERIKLTQMTNIVMILETRGTYEMDDITVVAGSEGAYFADTRPEEAVAETKVDFDALDKMYRSGIRRLDVEIIHSEAASTSEKELELLYEFIRKRSKLVHKWKENEHNLNESRRSSDINENFETETNINNKDVIGFVVERLKHLLELLKKDGIGRDNSSYKEIVNCRDKIALNDWNLACQSINIVMKSIRPFDIETTLDLYQKTENAARKVVGKDILLFLGHTGAGLCYYNYVFVCSFVLSICFYLVAWFACFFFLFFGFFTLCSLKMPGYHTSIRFCFCYTSLFGMRPIAACLCNNLVLFC